MKTVLVSARLPEKQDVIELFAELTNEEITRFVCEFECFDTIEEFLTKTISAKRFGSMLQLQKTRYSHTEQEYYSSKTLAVYIINYYDGEMFFVDAHFEENRPYDIAYAINSNTGLAAAYCKKCSSVISPAENLIGREYENCNCKNYS